MIKFVHSMLWTIVPITIALAASGCATKKFVRQQTGAVNARVNTLETKTNQQMAAMSAKERADISRVDERVTTLDSQLSAVSGVANKANSTASEASQAAMQANQLAEANQAKIDSNAKEMATLAENAWNYQVIEKGDVTFGFNQATLNNTAKMALDQIAQKAKTMPRAVVELEGFTDKVGSRSYNLALSRRRADAVARYLVSQSVPLRGIHVIGLGEEAPPAGLVADEDAVNPNATPRELQRLARRVRIRVYAPATSIAGEAARQQQQP